MLLALLSRIGLGGVSPTLIKDVLGVIAVAAVLFGIYEYGHSNGYESGFNKGVASNQPTIDTLTKTINDQRTQLAAKVTQVQDTAANAVVKSEEQQQTKIVTRTQIVDHYHNVEVPAKSTCTLALETTLTINSLLDTQTTYDNPAPVPDIPSREPSKPSTTQVEDEQEPVALQLSTKLTQRSI